MNAVEAWAWNEKVGRIVQEGNALFFELTGERYKRISPFLFQDTLFVKRTISGNNEISEIGPIADAMPGGYGSGYLSRFFTDEFGRKPSVVDTLSFVGRHGLGALEFRPESMESGVDAELYLSLEQMKAQSRRIYEGEHALELAKLIAVSNSAAGGAKAKAVVGFNPDNRKIHIAQKHDDEPEGFKKCIVKFNPKRGTQRKEYNNEIKAEYLYTLIAKEAGVIMSDAWLLEEGGVNYFVTERFDVSPEGERLHMHSLAGLFGHDASSFTMGYESLFRAGLALSVPQADKEQMFKTMVFNLVFSNRDDHSRNFSFLMDKQGSWRYAPAYDLTYSVHNYGANMHQLTINKKPAHLVRGIGIKKIAKICGVTDPLEIVAEMIKIKHERLHELVREQDLPSTFADEVIAATADIDKTFRR